MEFLVVPNNKLSDLETLNAASPYRKLIPRRGEQGEGLLYPRLLEDCGPGQTWENFGVFLKKLKTKEDKIKPDQSLYFTPAADSVKINRKAICDVCPFFNIRCTMAKVSCANCGKPENFYGTCPKGYWV